MSDKDDGGPAFPLPISVGPSGDVYHAAAWASGGMSLRDYFAAHAPQHRVEFDTIDQMLDFLGTKNVTPGGMVGNAIDAAKVQAKLAYIYADAMLAARAPAAHNVGEA